MKVARKTCDKCKILYPITTMTEKSRSVHSGSSFGVSTGFGKKKNVRWSGRNYSRNQKYWVCSDQRRCDNPESYQKMLAQDAIQTENKTAILEKYFERKGKLSQQFWVDKKNETMIVSECTSSLSHSLSEWEEITCALSEQWEKKRSLIADDFEARSAAEMDKITLEQLENVYSVKIPARVKGVLSTQLERLEMALLEEYSSGIRSSILMFPNRSPSISLGSDPHTAVTATVLSDILKPTKLKRNTLTVLTFLLSIALLSSLPIAINIGASVAVSWYLYKRRFSRPQGKEKKVFLAVHQFMEMEKSELDDCFEKVRQPYITSFHKDTSILASDILRLTNRLQESEETLQLLQEIEKSPRKAYKRLSK